jgi:hypothetical protein
MVRRCANPLVRLTGIFLYNDDFNDGGCVEKLHFFITIIFENILICFFAVSLRFDPFFFTTIQNDLVQAFFMLCC